MLCERMKVKCWVVVERFFRWGKNQRVDDLDKDYCHNCSGQPPPRENQGQRNSEASSGNRNTKSPLL